MTIRLFINESQAIIDDGQEIWTLFECYPGLDLEIPDPEFFVKEAVIVALVKNLV